MQLLVSEIAWARHGAVIRAVSDAVVPVVVPAAGPAPDVSGVEAAFLSRDLFVNGTRHRLAPEFLQYVEAIRAAPALRWVHIFSAGADLWVYREMHARGLTLTNSAGASAPAVAQTAIAGLLALARQLPRVMDAQARHAWEPLYRGAQPRALAGQTALILGTGPIGQEIARLCAALGMVPVGVRRDAAAGVPEGFARVASFADLPALLPGADWLIIACPLTETTRGLIGAAALAALPAGARLVNVARGGIVEEDAMLAALRSGHLAGAFSDVFTAEPLPADSPLWDAPGLIISPHSAAASDDLAERVAAIFADNLSRFLAGTELRNRITRVPVETAPA